ncbi:hypothetical protein MIR68_000836 [Amoeboaphelidium protococcarum]|nr:hypothetical protein MIR68_000836 [Amoeboaphelidium protococcarum]
MDDLDDLLNDLSNHAVQVAAATQQQQQKQQSSNAARPPVDSVIMDNRSMMTQSVDLDSLLLDLEGSSLLGRDSMISPPAPLAQAKAANSTSTAVRTSRPVLLQQKQANGKGNYNNDQHHQHHHDHHHDNNQDDIKDDAHQSLASIIGAIPNSPSTSTQPGFKDAFVPSGRQLNAADQQQQQHIRPNAASLTPNLPYPIQHGGNVSFATPSVQDSASMCADCLQPVTDSQQKVQALGQTFHESHFRCAQCKTLLNGQIFFEKLGKPWCEKCMNENFMLPKCAFCNEAIKGRCINALDKSWHPDHFFCSQCGKQFPPGTSFLEKDGKAYCEEDYYSMFAPKCATCDKPIMEEVVSALGKSFHSDCFICAESGCNIQLTQSGSFYDYNGKAYCEKHYHAARGSLCASCSKPIIGRCLTAIGKKFHPEHFVCAFCKKQLTTGGGGASTFKERDGKPYCVNDYIKLFG